MTIQTGAKSSILLGPSSLRGFPIVMKLRLEVDPVGGRLSGPPDVIPPRFTLNMQLAESPGSDAAWPIAKCGHIATSIMSAMGV